MAALNVILLVLFIIACVLIVFLVLLQNEEGDSIGGLFAGGSNSAFGSRSGNILTKSTYILVTFFFATSFLLAVLNKTSSSPSDAIKKEGQRLQEENAVPWYDQKQKEEDLKDSKTNNIESKKEEKAPSSNSENKENEESSEESDPNNREKGKE